MCLNESMVIVMRVRSERPHGNDDEHGDEPTLTVALPHQ
jgi:hypothetical protein